MIEDEIQLTLTASVRVVFKSHDTAADAIKAIEHGIGERVTEAEIDVGDIDSMLAVESIVRNVMDQYLGFEFSTHANVGEIKIST